MRAQHSTGPWFVLDQRASELRRLGWTGPEHDAIIITNQPPKRIIETQGDNCIVARIEFRNRDEELTEYNLADARLIAAAPDLLKAAEMLASLDEGEKRGRAFPTQEQCAFARAALAKARGAA